MQQSNKISDWETIKQKRQTKKEHFVLILILSLSSTLTSLWTETTIVMNYRSTVINLLMQLKISVKLIIYVFSSGFTLQEVEEIGSCQSSYYQLEVWQSWSCYLFGLLSRKNGHHPIILKNVSFCSPPGDQWVVVHRLVTKTRKLSMRTMQTKSIKHNCA